MRRTDVVFLLCLFVLTAVFVARSITQALPVLPGRPSSGATATGAAGQPRDVDMLQLKRMLERRALSGHEAEFYEPVGTVPTPDDGEEAEPGEDPGG
jgi:hypothetical protein